MHSSMRRDRLNVDFAKIQHVANLDCNTPADTVRRSCTGILLPYLHLRLCNMSSVTCTRLGGAVYGYTETLMYMWLPTLAQRVATSVAALVYQLFLPKVLVFQTSVCSKERRKETHSMSLSPGKYICFSCCKVRLEWTTLYARFRFHCIRCLHTDIVHM
jgi:hypothetical protein